MIVLDAQIKEDVDDLARFESEFLGKFRDTNGHNCFFYTSACSAALLSALLLPFPPQTSLASAPVFPSPMHSRCTLDSHKYTRFCLKGYRLQTEERAPRHPGRRATDNLGRNEFYNLNMSFAVSVLS
jgi:hypothetical protein